MLIATAGHVDHGKTTLVNALTGVDTDRLPEEKARGLTIDLGFAYTQRPDGTIHGFVDVPGHERFVRNMAAGVGAIDVALLVVAADDGPMPQTREHLAILSLFGISRAVVALTRSDLVDEDRLIAAEDEIHQLLIGTPLEDAPVVPVSAPNGVGIDTLQQHLDTLAAATARNTDGYFRLAVDRSFSVHGAGTVVTGAVFSGRVNTGDVVKLLPDGIETRIRSIHADGQEATSAVAGQRAALNLVGVQPEQAARGNWICDPDIDVSSTCIDVDIKILQTEDREFRHWTPVHVSSGASSVTGRVALYDVRTAAPGAGALGQLVLDEPVHMLFGDRFILRDQSASRTVGGGNVIDPYAARHRRFRRGRPAVLQMLREQDAAAALSGALVLSAEGLDAGQFMRGRGINSARMQHITQSTGCVAIERADGASVLVDAAGFEDLGRKIVDAVKAFHYSEPSAVGIDSESLAKNVNSAASLFYASIDALVRAGTLAREGVRIKINGHQPKLDAEQQDLLDKLLMVLTPDLIRPPPLSEMAEHCGMARDALSAAVDPLARAGHVVRVAENRLFHPAALSILADMAQTLAQEHAPRGFDAKAFRDHSGIGRNMSIDVLEYFDSVGITRRLADRRTFRRPLA